MDLTESIQPRSDQINADDLVGGPITYTIREVRQGVAESPFDFMLVETDRAYRPSKTMRRLIVAAWGPDANVYAGRRLTLYREPSIKFGGATVGGIRISFMSHIERRIEEKFQTTRGKREAFVVDPLPPVIVTDPRIAALRKEWNAADPERRKVIEAEVTALAEPEPTSPQPISAGHVTSLQILAAQKGFRDRGTRLSWAANVLGDKLDSFKDLTGAEATVVQNALLDLPDVPDA